MREGGLTKRFPSGFGLASHGTQGEFLF